MKKPKLMFMSPVDEGELVNQERYLVEILAWAQAEYQGIKLTLEHIKKLFNMVQRDEYPGDSVPDEIVLIYEKLAGDLEYAEELAEDQIEVVEPVKEENKMEVSEESKESLALVESISDGIELSSFSKKFDLGEGMTQCVPRGDVTMEDWVAAFGFGLALESGSQWIIGDAVVALENAGHEHVVNQLCGKFKKSYSTVSGYARACRAFEHGKRDPMLPFSVYREIGNASFGTQSETLKKQNLLLEQAKSEQLSSSEVRNRVKEEQGKNVDKPQPHRYLLLNVTNFSNSEILTQIPDTIEPHHLLIDLLGKRWYDQGVGEYMNFLKGK
jgi:hypothetical protein